MNRTRTGGPGAPEYGMKNGQYAERGAEAGACAPRAGRASVKKIGIIALAALLAFAPLCALGEGEANRGYGEYINPLYPDAILKRHAPDTDPDGMDLFRSLPEYTDTDSAAAAVLDMLKQHREKILFGFASTDRDPDRLLKKIMDTAFAHTGDPRGGDYIRWVYGGYYYTWTWEKDSSGVRHYEYEVTVTYYTTLEQEQELDRAVAALMPTLGLEGKTEYKKVRAIYDYITSHVTYDYDTLDDPGYYLKYTAYAALVNGTSVCQGYATLFYRLALEAGVDARLVYGKSGSELHSWNIAGIDGKYYLLDATWDAGMAEYGYFYFLKGSGDFAGHKALSDFLPQYALSRTDYPKTAARGKWGDGFSWEVSRDGALTLSGNGELEPFGGGAPWEEWISGIESVEIDNGITSVFSGAFADYPALRDVYLGEDVALIESGAFPMERETLHFSCGSYAHTWAKEHGYASRADDPSLPYGYIARAHRDLEIFPAVEATCTQDGLTEGSRCRFCGETDQVQTVVPAFGHAVLIDPAIPATCTEGGLTEGSHCCVCDRVLVPQQQVPALGHDMEIAYAADTSAGTVTVYRNCRRDETHNETETREVRFAALPAGLTAITEETFLGTGFTAVILPDGVTEIGDRAFADCPGLLYVRIPAGVKTIAQSAFSGSENAWIDRAG